MEIMSETMIVEVEIKIDTTTKIMEMTGIERGGLSDHGIAVQGDKDLALIQGTTIGIWIDMIGVEFILLG